MHRIIKIACVLTVFVSYTVNAQERTDFRYWDSLTYSDYNSSRWKELTDNAHRAITLGHDFYYMRMRLGISLFERRKYLLAIPHFRKALEYNNNDPVALEYIYYCYLYSARITTANAVAADFSPSLRIKCSIDENPKHRISLDYLFNNAQTEELIADYSGIEGYGTPGNLVIPSYFSNAGITIAQKTGDRTSITYGFTYLRRTNMLFYNDGIYRYDQYEQKLSQAQLYFSFTFSDKKGLTLTPAVHYLFTTYPLLTISSSGMNPRAYTYRVNENNFVTSVTLGKSAGIFEFVCEGAWSYLNYSNHLQAEGAVYLRPAANNNLYFGGGLALKGDEKQGEWSQGIVSSALLGFGIANRLWIDFSALFGNLQNYSDRSGYIVYNGAGEIDNIIKVDLSIPAGNKGAWLYAGVRYISEYTAFVLQGETSSSDYKNNFKSLSIIGGISWTF